MKISYLSSYARRVYALAVEVGAIKPGAIKEKPGDLGAVANLVAVIKALKSSDAAMLLCSVTRNDIKR